MGHQKPDPYKKHLANLTPPPEYTIPPRDPEIYLSTSPWQIMDYNYELWLKSFLLLDLFEQMGLEIGNSLRAISGGGREGDPIETFMSKWGGRLPTGPEIPEGLSQFLPRTDGKDFFYRNKMEYALYWDNLESKIKLAFHQRNSHRKIPITNSSIERPEILAKAKEIIADLNARGEEARTYQSLLLRCDQQGKVSGGLLKNHAPHPAFLPLTDTLLGHPYTYSPNGFFQINLPVYELALREIAQHLGNTDKVLDLYAGVGTIGLSVARDRRLTLVETNASAHAELLKNSAGLNSATPVLAKSEDALDFITNDTTVIVDPPRAGLHPKLIEKLNIAKPPVIIYLSCNPITQARDLSPLTKNYKITKNQPFNFFPRTPHIENLTILTLKT